MSSKQQILANIRKHRPASSPLPDLNEAWIEYEDREAQFWETLKFVGGQGQSLDDRSQLEAAVRQLPCFPDARQIVCRVAGLSLGNVDVDSIDDPHDLASVDLAILPGEFAVAENGAVWVTERTVRHRAIYFLTQHLVLVAPRGQLLDNLHQAYERLRFGEPGYGLFISGPSKTADIEQSLVIGAHGPRSLNVFLV
ncbi:MAG: LUD domain-containing protein [Planctomycetales bacterium]|nr:LUD domain-containing protein [Planctomycetales bacterium]MCA9224576.1 LUD domain-containing protein [Planctomycetales bacterium]